MDLKTVKKLERIVAQNYEDIGSDFSATRHRPWPEFDLYKELCASGMKVLDLGCGNGRLYWQALKDRKVKYTGVDPSKALLAFAQKSKDQLKTKKEKAMVVFKKGTMQKIPATARQFDRLFCIAAFHHLPGKKQRLLALREMRRVVKPGGYIVISIWNLFQWQYMRYLLAGVWRWVKTKGTYDWNDTLFYWGQGKSLRYYHAFTPGEMRDLLRECRLEVVQEYWERPWWRNRNLVWVCRVG